MHEVTIFAMFVTVYIIGVGIWKIGCLFYALYSIRLDQTEEEIKEQEKSFYRAPFWPLYLVLAFVKYMIKSCDIFIEDINKLI